jgi:hypothetical protein
MMVRIRYSDLPVGLHVSVVARGRGTVIYLLPGLTAAQRRAALARARSSARMGQGPALPPLSLAVAIAADRTRTTLRNGAAAMRAHPVLLLPALILLVSSAIVFVLTSFVTLTLHNPTAAPTTGITVGTSPGVHSHHRGAAPGSAGQPGTGRGSSGTDPRSRGSASPTPTPSATIGPGPRPTSPDPTPTSAPSTAPTTPTPASPSPDPTSAAPTPTPSPSPAASCLELGPLGICVHL